VGGLVVALQVVALVCFVNEAELPRDPLNDAGDTWFHAVYSTRKVVGPNTLGKNYIEFVMSSLMDCSGPQE
jgi:hypothetical protein